MLAFSAWNLTGLATGALALLCLLFALDVPRHWGLLRRDTGVWLLLGALGITSVLAVRAAAMFPSTAALQSEAVWEWSRPFLFVVVAWWLRGDPIQVRRVLAAALLGLLVGVLRKTEWSDLAEIAEGQRADFGFAALGLGFLASIALLGLFSFHQELQTLRVGGRPHPVLGWAGWSLLGMGLLALLFFTQARGATLALAIVTLSASVLRARAMSARRGGSRYRLGVTLLSGVLMLSLVIGVLWASRDRIVGDLASLGGAPTVGQQSYASSLGTRINLYRVGLALFAERPWLGWGPGSSGTELLVPIGAIELPEHDRVHVPAWSHLHSVLIEVLVRFGLVGIAFGLLLLVTLLRAYRALWRSSQDAALRDFLVLGGIMTGLNFLYDFRLVNLDLSFFFILFFGIVYSFQVRRIAGEPMRG